MSAERDHDKPDTDLGDTAQRAFMLLREIEKYQRRNHADHDND